MTADNDGLLDALDRFAAATSAHRIDSSSGLVEAIDDWVSEHAGEHHRSEPFIAIDVADDRLGAGVAHLVAAVRTLAMHARSDLTAAAALTEAINDWVERSARVAGVAHAPT